MSFEDYWAEVEKRRDLPEMAIKHLPGSLKDETKKKLMKLSPEETAEKLRSVIEEVNRESVENVDSLLKKKLE